MISITEIKDRLKANPIYALSLSSRELFHSNFLAWMFENYPVMIAVIFDGPIFGEIKIEREKSNLDLIITFGDASKPQVIAIEIKVKDAPIIGQLKDYNKKIDKHWQHPASVERILLSLVEAPESLESTSWRHLRFSDLARKISALTSLASIRDEHNMIIKYYVDLCYDLEMLVKRAAEVDQKTHVYFFDIPQKDESRIEIDDALKELRFADTLNKHRASALCEKMKSQAADVAFKGFKPVFSYGFDRKMPHVGASMVLEKDHSPDFKLSLGIHIQGKQYRRMLSFSRYAVSNYSKSKNQERIRTFIEETDRWAWMFGDMHANGYFEKIDGHNGFFETMTKVQTGQQKNKLLCSYGHEHIYQYTNIGVDGGVPIDNVIAAVIADLHLAAQFLNDDAYVTRFENWSPRVL